MGGIISAVAVIAAIATKPALQQVLTGAGQKSISFDENPVHLGTTLLACAVLWQTRPSQASR